MSEKPFIIIIRNGPYTCKVCEKVFVEIGQLVIHSPQYNAEICWECASHISYTYRKDSVAQPLDI